MKLFSAAEKKAFEGPPMREKAEELVLSHLGTLSTKTIRDQTDSINTLCSLLTGKFDMYNCLYNYAETIGLVVQNCILRCSNDDEKLSALRLFCLVCLSIGSGNDAFLDMVLPELKFLMQCPLK